MTIPSSRSSDQTKSTSQSQANDAHWFLSHGTRLTAWTWCVIFKVQAEMRGMEGELAPNVTRRACQSPMSVRASALCCIKVSLAYFSSSSCFFLRTIASSTWKTGILKKFGKRNWIKNSTGRFFFQHIPLVEMGHRRWRGGGRCHLPPPWLLARPVSLLPSLLMPLCSRCLRRLPAGQSLRALSSPKIQYTINQSINQSNE